MCQALPSDAIEPVIPSPSPHSGHLGAGKPAIAYPHFGHTPRDRAARLRLALIHPGARGTQSSEYPNPASRIGTPMFAA